jgi:hypothetical protein
MTSLGGSPIMGNTQQSPLMSCNFWGPRSQAYTSRFERRGRRHRLSFLFVLLIKIGFGPLTAWLSEGGWIVVSALYASNARSPSTIYSSIVAPPYVFGRRLKIGWIYRHFTLILGRTSLPEWWNMMSTGQNHKGMTSLSMLIIWEISNEINDECSRTSAPLHKSSSIGLKRRLDYGS